MAFNIRFAIRAPHASGMIIGGDEDNRRHYSHITYHHPSDPHVFFACAAASVTLIDDVRMHTGLYSFYKGRSIPPKPDFNVYAIPWWEAERIQQCEVLWFKNYESYLQRYPGDEAGAVAFAHSMVKIHRYGE